MKEVLIITNRFPFGKDETFLETEINFFNNTDAKVTIFSQNTEEYKRKTPEPINIVFSNKNNFNIWSDFIFFSMIFLKELFKNFSSLYKIKVQLAHYIEAIRLYKEIKPIYLSSKNKDDFSIYSYWYDVSTLASLFLKSVFPKIKVNTRVHGGDLYIERHQKNYLPFRDFGYKTIDKVICISAHGQNYLNQKYPQYADKFYLSYLGIINKTKNNELKNDILKVVSCSHINPIKRLDLLIDSLVELNQACEWYHLGYGFDFNEKPIKEKAKKDLTNSLVKYNFEGQIDNDKIILKYNSEGYNLFINVSSSEGLPVSMMEAMSCGIPVIGTDVGGVSEIIKDNYNGLLLSANPKPKEVAQAISKYKNLSLEEKKQMSLNAYNTWNKLFNAEKNYPSFVNLLLNL